MTTLYHCSDSLGLGAFVSSVVGANAVSSLSNSTFVLGSNCTTEASRMNIEVARRFDIPLRTVPRDAQHIRLTNHPFENKFTHDTVQDHDLKHPAFCLINSEHTGIDKLFRGKYGAQNQRSLRCSSYDTCFGETVDRLFKPKQHMLRMYTEWLAQKNLTLPYSVLHVRLGDANMVSTNTTKWKWRNQQRNSMFRSRPAEHLLYVRPNVSVVLSDSTWVRELAKSLGFRTVDTPAIHMGMSDVHTANENVDGLFLEWMIMHRAESCFNFDASMFSRTACMLRMKRMPMVQPESDNKSIGRTSRDVADGKKAKISSG